MMRQFDITKMSGFESLKTNNNEMNLLISRTVYCLQFKLNEL